MKKYSDIEMRELEAKAKYFDKIFKHYAKNFDIWSCRELWEFLETQSKIMHEAQDELVQFHNEKNDYNTYLQLKKRFEK